MLKIRDILIDYVAGPQLAKTTGLRFSWKLESDIEGIFQKSYRLTISENDSIAFDSGTVESGKCFDITFDNLVLKSRTNYKMHLSITDNYGNIAKEDTCFSTEILPEEWGSAKWIKPSLHISGWAPYLRCKFTLGNIKSAVMYASGLGCAEYYINGQKTDDYYIDPPMTNYEKNVFYRRYDITNLLKCGGNAVCVLLGEGFYSQSRVWGHTGFVYGDVCAKIRIEITLEDGTQKTVVTDTENWKYKYSPISVNNIYGGETYDSRLETSNFSEYDGSDNGWENVIEDETPKGVLTPCNIRPVRIIRRLPAVSMHPCSGKNDGAWIFDIGENMAGIAEFHLPHSPKGAVYVFRYAETLSESGNLDFRSAGTFATQCIQQDIYIARGDEGGETYRPIFCYHGFRYVEVTGIHDFSKGYGTLPDVSLVCGLQLSTDFPKITTFETSYKYLNDLYRIMDNTYRSNFHGFPEDCPAREKCGWLGDAQVVCNWGMLNYNSAAEYEKYLNDIRTTKEVYGVWQMISPGKRGCGEASPLWGCAQIIIPYYLYKYYGDSEAITRNFDLMEAWVAHECARAEDYIISVGLGDWDPPEGNGGSRRMPVPHSSTLMFYEISILMSEICTAFDMGSSEYYASLAEKIKKSFIKHFYNYQEHSYGFWGTDGVALMTGIYPDDERAVMITSLVNRIKSDNYAMPTGIYANKYLVPMLFGEGYGDVALKFLFNTERSSFATMLNDNATTIWEEPDMHSVECRDVGTASYNHPMHGGFLYFCVTHVAGISPLKPGFETFKFKPCHADKIDAVKLSYESASGTIKVSYHRTESGFEYSLTVPPTSSCTVALDYASEIIINGKRSSNMCTLTSGDYIILTKK